MVIVFIFKCFSFNFSKTEWIPVIFNNIFPQRLKKHYFIWSNPVQQVYHTKEYKFTTNVIIIDWTILDVIMNITISQQRQREASIVHHETVNSKMLHQKTFLLSMNTKECFINSWFFFKWIELNAHLKHFSVFDYF